MLRTLHSIPGLIAALLLVVLAITGSVLSVFPTLEQARARNAGEVDVATLVSRASAAVTGLETLVRQPSGVIVAYHLVGEAQRASVIDPASGAAVAEYRPSTVQRWMKNLHRKLLMGDAGRILTGVVAASLLFIVVSGLLLLAHRMGGWRRLFDPVRGNTLQRLHSETSRLVAAALVLSSTTGLLMSLGTFGVIPEGGGAEEFHDLRPGTASAMAFELMPALQAIDLSRLRQLKLAAPGDAGDAIELETLDGAGSVDPATGAWLSYRPLDGWQRLHAVMHLLHTGDGLWWLGLLLGAASTTVPLLAVTGTLLWLRRRRGLVRLMQNASADSADTVLLVGSEGNTTWGFAVALHDALTLAGLQVHTAPMNAIAASYRKAKHLLVLTASYGDGEAPESARQFLAKVPSLRVNEGLRFAVLGFGDRQFPQFCGFARKVHDALAAKGFRPLSEPSRVDRQSEPEFRKWCEWLAQTLEVALDIRYVPLLPRTVSLKLVSRTDYGNDPATLTSVLRFIPEAHARRWRASRRTRLPPFGAGDLLGVLPPGGASPRYYSLASSATDGLAEICVRRHPDGLCSSYLTALQPGATIEAFVRPNESFRPAPGAAPVVLIGAGTGIGPLIGFIRHNPPQRPMHLYFGARNDNDGFLYREELADLVGDRRLRTLTTAFSRSAPKSYVQDRLASDASRLRELVAQGAQILVCGGRTMAKDVANAWERILARSDVSLAQLRMQGRYVEDVY